MERSGRKVWWMSKLKEFWYDLVLIVGNVLYLYSWNDLYLYSGDDHPRIVGTDSDLLLINCQIWGVDDLVKKIFCCAKIFKKIWKCGEILLYLLCSLLVYDLDYIMFSDLLSYRYLDL